MVEKGKSRIVNKIQKRTKGAWKKSREKEAEVKGAQLPSGIIGGVAKFIRWEFKETDKGIPFLSLAFLVLEPDEFSGFKQYIRFYFQDTKFKTVQEVCDELSSTLQLMGEDLEGTTEEDWERLLESLQKDEVCIRYNTRSGKTNDGNAWFKFDVQGLADEPDEPEDFEEEPDRPSAEDDEPEDDDSDDSEPDEPEDDDSTDDDSDDSDDSDASDEDTGDWSPAKKEIYMYRVNGRSKPRECAVVTVNKSKETVSLKRVDDGKDFKDVPWDKLEGEDE